MPCWEGACVRRARGTSRCVDDRSHMNRDDKDGKVIKADVGRIWNIVLIYIVVKKRRY